MFAIAIDGELIATLESKREVVEKLRDRQIQDKLFFDDVSVEIASFNLERKKWIPVCLDKFAGDVLQSVGDQ